MSAVKTCSNKRKWVILEKFGKLTQKIKSLFSKSSYTETSLEKKEVSDEEVNQFMENFQNTKKNNGKQLFFFFYLH